MINAAAYSHDATLTFAADARTGAETGRLVKEGMTGEALARSRSKRVERVRARSVDSLLAAHGLERVAWLKVDVEGFDPYVLRGAERALRRRAVAGLMFEYSEQWERVNASHTLRGVVRWLDALEYRSYLVGRTRLVALSGDQWRDAYAGDGNIWLDVVAFVADSEFERIFLRSYGRPLPCAPAVTSHL